MKQNDIGDISELIFENFTFISPILEKKSPAFLDFGLKIFWRPKSKSAMMSMCKIHIYIDSGRYRKIHGKM